MLYFPKETHTHTHSKKKRFHPPFHPTEWMYKMLMRMWLEYLMLKSSDKKSIDLFWKGAGMTTMKTKNKEFLVIPKHDWMLFKKKLAATFSSCIRRFYSTTHIFVSLLSFFGESADFFLCVGSYGERTKIFYCWWDYIEQWRIFHTILFDAMILISQTFSLFLLDSNWLNMSRERKLLNNFNFFMC